MRSHSPRIAPHRLGGDPGNLDLGESDLTPDTAAMKKRRPNKIDIGARVREVRKSKKLTLQALADATRLSVSTISKIENNQTVITYDTMVLLADGLGIALVDLLAEKPADLVSGRRALTRASEGRVYETNGYRLELLCTDISHRRAIPFLATLKHGSIAGFGQLLHHPGEEFFYVLSGSVELYTELYEPVVLNEGDSAYFDATMGHGLISLSDPPARVLWIQLPEPKGTRSKAAGSSAAEA